MWKSFFYALQLFLSKYTIFTNTKGYYFKKLSTATIWFFKFHPVKSEVLGKKDF